MELAKLKELTEFAKKAGIKSLKFEDVSIEFRDVMPPARTRARPGEESSFKITKEAPTLDEINHYIYNNDGAS